MTRVLLLEDEFATSYEISTLLNENGMDVDVCDSASRAIQLLKTDTYDVVIADIIVYHEGRSTPDGGVMLIGWMRSPTQEDKRLVDLPILCISGAVNQPGLSHFLDMAMTLGADDSLSKPFNDIELLAAVERLISRGRSKTVQREPSQPSDLG